MLSKRTQILTLVCAVMYVVLGTILFVVPTQMSSHFAWNVSPFVTMTIGGWCLGNAWSALMSALNWKWPINHPALIYLWVFGLTQTLVLVAFQDKLRLEHPIAWLYVAALIFSIVAALSGIIDIIQTRPTIKDPDEEPFGPVLFGFAIFFVSFVAFLGIYGLTVPMGNLGTNQEIFPEMMSAFTLRSFGAFYLSLALAAVPMWFTKSRRSLVHYGVAQYALVVQITFAAAAFWPVWDFQSHPFQSVYWIAYIGVGIVTAASIIYYQKNAT